jgi:hypothetical protein
MTLLCDVYICDYICDKIVMVIFMRCMFMMVIFKTFMFVGVYVYGVFYDDYVCLSFTCSL